VHRFLEPTRIKPRLGQLKTLLYEAAVTSDELTDIESATGEKRQKRSEGFTLDELIGEVQASEAEIKQGLEQLGAFCTPSGGYRVLSRELEERVITQLSLEMNAQDVDDPNTHPLNQLIDSLSEFPLFVTEAICNKYRSAEGGLDVLKFVRFMAESLLVKNLEIAFNGFESALRDSVPVSCVGKYDIDLAVKDLAIKDEDKGVWVFLPFDSLPRDAKKRCEILFDRRYCWQHAELEAYLDGVDGGINEAIQKYARMATDAKGRKGFIRR
jgi:hypothetical protein